MRFTVTSLRGLETITLNLSPWTDGPNLRYSTVHIRRLTPFYGREMYRIKAVDILLFLLLKMVIKDYDIKEIF